MNENEHEIISAIYSFNPLDSEDEIELQKKKDEIDSKLQRYENNADTIDYAIAASSGVICGLLDSFFVGEFSITKADINLSHKQINGFIMDLAKKNGYKGERLNGAIGTLEEKFKVAQDNIWKSADIGVSTKDHHLADFAHHPTLLGLISSIIVQFFRVGIFVNKDGEMLFLGVGGTSAKDMICTWAPVVISGVLNWLVYVAERKIKDEKNWEIPKPIKPLIHVIASTPVLIKVLKVANNWAGHMVSDMGGSKNTAGGGMGIPGIFVSLAYEIASLPGLKDTGMPKEIRDLYTKQKFDFRHELPALKILGKQTLVVLFNETIVRTFYFVRRLITQIKDNGLSNVDWSKVIPFNNKTIMRMTTISSTVFETVDLTDAAIRSIMVSAGEPVTFTVNFVKRVNFVGAGRLLISVASEIKMSVDESKLLSEKLAVTEELSEKKIASLLECREKVGKLVEQYLADDLESFLNGMSLVRSGMISGDSNAVIHGNVIIQRKLGREIQFKNQNEFDELMLSDTALKL